MTHYYIFVRGGGIFIGCNFFLCLCKRAIFLRGDVNFRLTFLLCFVEERKYSIMSSSSPVLYVAICWFIISDYVV